MTEIDKNELDYKFRVARLIGEITHLSVLINSLTEMSCVVEYSGYVNQIEVVISPKSWDEFERVSEENLSAQFYVDGWSISEDDGNQSVIKKLLIIKKELKQILKDKQIDYGVLGYEVETIEYKRYYLGATS